MNKKIFTPLKSSFFLLMFGVLVIVSGCEKKVGPDPEPEPDPEPTGEVTYAEINQWVVDSMRYYYYWNSAIPADNRLNLNSKPEDFFETMLKLPDDRFSWIQNNEELRNSLSGIIRTSGLGLAFFRIGDNNAGATVRFVHKGSPADLAGIKRGDIFIRVNGQLLTVSDGNVQNADALFGNDPFTVTKGEFTAAGIGAADDVSLTPVEGFVESAIHLDSVIVTPNGTKVGYIFYNRFLQTQAQELVDVFDRFKAQGITELIIDERYNSGGSVGIAGLFAAMIHKGFNINEPFIQYKLNNNFRDETLSYGDLFGTDNAQVVSNVNVGVDRVFVLATGSSASASELLINNLRPIMGEANVVHIGGATVGKDDASITISNSSSRFSGENDWGIQPIVLKYKNRDGVGDFVDGLIPTYQINETVPYAPMGSGSDPLIARALSIIDPALQALYNQQMSVNRMRETQYGIVELEAFNRQLSDPRPLDVTNTIGQYKKPLDLR